MSRARGKGLSRNPSSKPRGLDHGRHSEFSPVPTYVGKRLGNPSQRPRVSGVVGPELDWSVRYSNVPLRLFRLITAWNAGCPHWIMLAFTTPPPTEVSNELKSASDAPYWKVDERSAKTRPKAGCTRTFDWTDAQVSVWTRFCHVYGIQFAGKADYKVPKALLISNDDAARGDRHMLVNRWPKDIETVKTSGLEDFRFMKQLGYNPKHNRKVGKNHRFIRRRRFVVKPTTIDDLMVIRHPSRRESLKYGLDRTSFHRFSCGRGLRSPIPSIVARAIESIYSKPVKTIVKGFLHNDETPRKESDSTLVSKVSRIPNRSDIYRIRKNRFVKVSKFGRFARAFRSTIPVIDRSLLSGTRVTGHPEWGEFDFGVTTEELSDDLY